MIAPQIHGISKECCRPPLRGTVAGFVQHNAAHTTLCGPCVTARRTYLHETIADRALRPAPRTWQERATRAFVEDYMDLIATGETHPEMIASRLGTTPQALERRLHRNGIHILHNPRPIPTQRPTTQPRRSAVAA